MYFGFLPLVYGILWYFVIIGAYFDDTEYGRCQKYPQPSRIDHSVQSRAR